MNAHPAPVRHRKTEPRAGGGRLLTRCLVLLLVLFTAPVAATPSAAANGHASGTCTSHQVPVTVPGVGDASLYGELCVPRGQSPETVQLLVHGGTYTGSYWDWPFQSPTYSYVEDALRAGYATFAVDRLGAGRSTHPTSSLVTLRSGAEPAATRSIRDLSPTHRSSPATSQPRT